MNRPDNNTSPPRAPAKKTAPTSLKTRLMHGRPIVKFTKGSFKSFRYDQDEGKIVRVK